MGFIAEEAIERAKSYIEANMKPARRQHTENVVKTAQKLCERFGGDGEKATVAAWYHDLARNLPAEELDERVRQWGLDENIIGRPNLSHSKVACEMMKRDFGIEDEEILAAVAFHTTGRAGMSLLEKIVFLADAIEPARDYPGVEEIRKATELGIDEGCLCSLENTIEHVKEQGRYMDPDTIEARDDFLRIVGEDPKTGGEN